MCAKPVEPQQPKVGVEVVKLGFEHDHRDAGRMSAFGQCRHRMGAGGIVVATFAFALTLGGASIAERTFTLFAQDPVTLYSASRGGQLVYTFDDLVNSYPLGAGLGRWGMIQGYFGSGHERPLWAEIQVAGWAIDGGFPLVIVSVGALVVALLADRKLALFDADAKVRACAGVGGAFCGVWAEAWIATVATNTPLSAPISVVRTGFMASSSFSGTAGRRNRRDCAATSATRDRSPAIPDRRGRCRRR